MPQTGGAKARRDADLESACGTGSYEWRPAEDRLVWSPGLIRMYGLPHAPAARDGFSRLVHPEDRVRVEADTSVYLASDAESFSRSFRVVRPDGSVRFILDRGAIERDEKGVARVIRGLNVDLTDLAYPDGCAMAGERSGIRQVEEVVEIEERLRESEAALLHAQRCAGAGVWDVYFADNRVTWSEPYYDLYGLPRSVKPSHESWIASIHPDDRERVDREFAQAVAGRGVQRIEFRILRDGQVRWLHSEGRVICDSSNRPLRVTGITWDITERKLAEEALRESEERLRLALDAGCMAAWDWHIPTGAVQWNEEHYRMLGYEPGEVKPGYETWAARVLPEDFPATEALLLRTMEHGGDYQTEFRALGQKDQISWLEARGRFERDSQGRPIRSYGVMMDITERKRAEEALRESEARLQAVLDGSLDPIFMKDREGRMVLANPATCAAIGKPAEFVLGKTDEQFLDNPADARAIMANDRRIMLSGEPETVEEAVSTPSGTRYYVNKKLARRDAAGNVIGLISTAHDVTEQKRAEEALRESEERYRQLADAMPQLVWTASSDGVVDYYNARAVEYGIAVASSPTYYHWEPAIHPDDLAPTWEAWREAVAQGQPYQKEQRLLMADGGYRWHLSRGRPQRNEEGLIVKWFGTATDIDDFKRAEEALHESEARLQAVLDGSPDPIFVKDREGRQVMANPATYAAIGKPAEACLGKTDEEFLDDPADGRAIMASDHRIMASGRAETVEEMISTQSGTRYFVSNKTPYRDAAGNIIGLIGTSHDVTELKQAENALRESEKRERLKRQELEAILEAIPAAVFISEDRACARMSLNRAGHELLRLPTNANPSLSAPEGEAPQHFEVRSNGRFLTPGELPLQCAAATGRAIESAEFELCFEDGDCKHFLGNALPLLDDAREVRGAVGAFIDITERKRAEKALRESEERYRQLADAERQRRQELETTLAVLPVGVFIAEDKACARITANPAGNALLRISEGRNASTSALEDGPSNFGTYSATGEVLAADQLPMQRAAATGESIEDFEHELRFAEGGHTHLLGNALPLFDAAGEVRGAVGAFLDITERRHQEERIKLLLREVNHRAKNMLAVVQSVARQTAATSPKEFLERFSERIQALATSQDLLVKAEWRGVELAELVRGQLAHFQDLIGSRIELEGPSLLVSASAAQTLGMAIHELSTNAGKYGALSVTEGCVAIEWGLERDGAGGESFVMSWREQDGPPVSPPSRNGFGSAVIGALAESSLDAKVDLDFLKTGLSWRLCCPAAGVIEGARSAPAAKARPELRAPSNLRPKVLVVEDEALVAMEIAQVLRDADFEVLGPARSVAAALSLIEESGCDAAVLDINLTRETSEPVARKLLADGTRFVTLSGYSHTQHLPIFDGVPALAKPLRPALLVAEIRRCLLGQEKRPDECSG